MREFVPPPRTFVGPGSRSALSRIVGDDVENVHVVTDEGVAAAGVLESVTAHLRAEPTIHDEVSANPDRETVLTLASRVADADLVVGVGGGSPMDAAKAACALPAFSDRLVADLDVTAETRVESPGRVVPSILVPTTAGTGTETGYWAVISDHDSGEKCSIGHPAMLAEAAILDPELTTTLPPTLTAGTGFDVLTHAVESLVADGASALTIPYSRHAFALAMETLQQVTADGEDLLARERMLEASYLAGVAMNNAGLGAVHAISHAIGGLYDLPHGHTNALLLPTVVRLNGERSPRTRERYASLLEHASLGEASEPTHEVLADRLARLRRDVDLADLPPGAPADWAWEEVASAAVANVNAATNPVEFTEDDVVERCRTVFSV